ncbi:MAG: asparagine synthase (glutamine-hydrolyzing), partial [Terriglobales bacterium]
MAMVSMLQHRGPDDSNVWTSGGVALGHACLSIIDLAGGAQPMSNGDGTIWITFNGEIFNYIELREDLSKKGHIFLTRSDTEVILAAYREYGEDCVHRFNGQWAFALWDAPERKLFLSRDRLGVRPLFYTSTPKCFAFASEAKALFACTEISPQLDLRALHQIFTFWVTLPPRTAFKNISQLPPGCSLTVKDGKLRITRYWKLEYASAPQSVGNEKQLAEELLALLMDAATIRLRSDVPVGAYLSGGIDSTVTTALISRVAGQRLRTFSVSFEDAEFDESAYQCEASAFLHTQHSDVRCSTEDIAGVFSDVIW